MMRTKLLLLLFIEKFLASCAATAFASATASMDKNWESHWPWERKKLQENLSALDPTTEITTWIIIFIIHLPSPFTDSIELRSSSQKIDIYHFVVVAKTLNLEKMW